MAGKIKLPKYAPLTDKKTVEQTFVYELTMTAEAQIRAFELESEIFFYRMRKKRNYDSKEKDI